MLSGEEMGIGESRAVFSPCSPCSSGATMRSRRRKSEPASVSRSRALFPQPPSLLPADPTATVASEWAAGSREGRQVPSKP